MIAAMAVAMVMVMVLVLVLAAGTVLVVFIFMLRGNGPRFIGGARFLAVHSWRCR